MLAYKQVITLTDPQNTVLTGLPFRAGQRVEIVIFEDDETLGKSPAKVPYKKLPVDHIMLPSRDELHER